MQLQLWAYMERLKCPCSSTKLSRMRLRLSLILMPLWRSLFLGEQAFQYERDGPGEHVTDFITDFPDAGMLIV